MRGLREHLICRLCLSSGCRLIDILEECRNDEFVVKQAVEDLLRLVVMKEALYPWLVCSICLEKLREFHFFKQRRVENQEVYDSRIRGNNWPVNQVRSTECDDIPIKSEEGNAVEDPLHPDSFKNIDSDHSNQPFAEDLTLDSKVAVKCEEDGSTWESMELDSHNPTDYTSFEMTQSATGHDSDFDIGDVSIHDTDFKSSGSEQDGDGRGVSEKGREAVSDQDAVSRFPPIPVVLAELDTVSTPANAFGGTDASKRGTETEMSGSGRGRSIGRGGSSSCFGRRKVREKFICVECGAAFVSRLTLSTHVRAHLSRNEDLSSGKGREKVQGNEHGTSFLRLNYDEVMGTRCDLSREGFICDHCGKAFTRKYQMISHICAVHLKECVLESTATIKSKKSKVNRDLFSCDRCGKRFLQKVHLLRHIHSVHLGLKSFVYNICSQSFSRKHVLKAHVIAVHNWERYFKCELCGKAFKRGTVLEVHVKKHLENSSFPFTRCPSSFLLNHRLRPHMESLSGRMYNCVVCRKEFKEKLLLQKHIKRHSEEILFNCQECSKAFKTNRELKQHSLVHSRLLKNSCEVCGKKFSRSGHLSSHMRTHDGKRPFECELCHKKFSESSSVSRHMRTHDKKKAFECELCHKKFSQSSSLTRHMWTHDGKRPFECELCHKKFSRNDILNNHMRTHDGKGPFECELCHKKFSQSGNLSTHLRTHDGKRPLNLSGASGSIPGVKS